MTNDAVAVELDGNVLESVADLVCGDDGTAYYRRGFEIVKFFEAAGWNDVGELEGSRRAWVVERLKERRDDPDALRKVLLRLADPREYLDNDDGWDETVRELNQLLAVEGYQVVFERGRPTLIEQDPTLRRPARKAPLELTASLADIVSDRDFGQALRDYRNLVHPKKQLTQNYDPDEDTVRVSWNVVVAVLNDLVKPA